MEKIKLSICIPTFNRCDCLDECLNSILSQITDEYKNYIYVEVFDDASTDNTNEIVKKHYEKCNIIYKKNITNLGMDRNFQKMYYESQGDYIFTISDDDILLPGALNYIYNFILCNQDIDVMHLNSKSFIYKYEINNLSKPRLNLNNDLYPLSKEDFISTLGIWVTALSGVILNRRKLIPREESNKYIGSYFLQAHLALLSCVGDSRLAILHYPCIAIRAENSGGYNFYYVWCYSYKRLLFDTAIKAGFSKKSIKKIYESSMINSLRSRLWIIRSTNTTFRLKNKFLLFKSTICFPKLWIFFYPIAFLPVSILKKVRCIKDR